MRIPASVILSMIAITPHASMMASEPIITEFGYLPTANKHIAKRQKRKRQRLQAEALAVKSCIGHKERNKKGRP